LIRKTHRQRSHTWSVLHVRHTSKTAETP
jgi:hypothetical protein